MKFYAGLMTMTGTLLGLVGSLADRISADEPQRDVGLYGRLRMRYRAHPWAVRLRFARLDCSVALLTAAGVIYFG